MTQIIRQQPDQKINIVGEKSRFFSDQKNRGIFIVSDKDNPNHLNPYFTNLNYGTNYFFDGYGVRNIKNFIKKSKSTNHKNYNQLNSTFSIHSYQPKLLRQLIKV